MSRAHARHHRCHLPEHASSFIEFCLRMCLAGMAEAEHFEHAPALRVTGMLCASRSWAKCMRSWCNHPHVAPADMPHPCPRRCRYSRAMVDSSGSCQQRWRSAPAAAAWEGPSQTNAIDVAEAVPAIRAVHSGQPAPADTAGRTSESGKRHARCIVGRSAAGWRGDSTSRLAAAAAHLSGARRRIGGRSSVGADWPSATNANAVR